MDNLEESRLINKARRDFLLYRIIDGRLPYEDSYIRDPLYKTKLLGSRVYYETLTDCIDVLSDRDIYIFLVSTNQWSFEEQQKLDLLPKEIEKLKIDLYKNYSNPAKRKEIKFTLANKKENLTELFGRRNKYYNLTKEGIALGAKWYAMIPKMYKGKDWGPAIRFYQSNFISEEDIRSICLDSDFVSYFNASKNIFGRPSIKMTDDQRRLLMWSTIYKNVRGGMDPPSDRIIEDHDAFDGYLIFENRKSKGAKKAEQKGIDPNAKTVYFGQMSKDEHEEVMALNSPEAIIQMNKEFKK